MELTTTYWYFFIFDHIIIKLVYIYINPWGGERSLGGGEADLGEGDCPPQEAQTASLVGGQVSDSFEGNVGLR